MDWLIELLGLVVAVGGTFLMVRFPDLIRGVAKIPLPFGKSIEIPANAGLVLVLVGIGLTVYGLNHPPPTDDSDEENHLATMHQAGSADEPNGSDIVRLTGAQGNEAGAVWTNTRHDVTSSFTAEFDFEITPVGDKGSDGLAFVIQAGDDEAVGARGGGLGYHGLRNSIAIEFDAWQNRARDRITAAETMTADDPSRSHIAVHTRGTAANNADPAIGAAAVDVPRLDDSNQHRARVRYDGATLHVWLDGKKYVTLPIHISSRIGSPVALVGLTAGSGSADVAATHDVSRFVFKT